MFSLYLNVFGIICHILNIFNIHHKLLIPLSIILVSIFVMQFKDVFYVSSSECGGNEKLFYNTH